jgi:hypothetical protein
MLNVGSRLAWLLLALLIGCGEEGAPHPGYAEPCDTPMGGVLDCPASTRSGSMPTIHETCQRLVSCGILAAEELSSTGNDCSTSDDCSPGQHCLSTSSGDKCHSNRLDYQWCVVRLTTGYSSFCPGGQHFSQEQVDSIIRCIAATPCTSLGLTFEQKVSSSDHRPELDKFTCPDGKNATWTATICDHGLLDY